LKKVGIKLADNQKLITANNAQLDDILELAKSGKLKLIQAIFDKSDLKEIVYVRGISEYLRMFDHDYSTSRWNPINFAIYFGHLEVVQYFCEELKGRISPHHYKGDILYFHVNASEYGVHKDDDYLMKLQHRLESLWFTIYNNDIETFKYLWSIGAQFFTTKTIIKVLQKLTEHEWVDGMKALMLSPSTRNLILNLPSKMIDEFFKQLFEPIYLADYTVKNNPDDFLKIYEDHIDILQEDISAAVKEVDRDMPFYSQDLIY
jgi:hypothetical protein